MYQYKLTFSLEKSWLPRNLDSLMVSFLKASAQACSQEFYEKLYDKGKSIMKSYSFSYYLPGAKFEKEKVILGSNTFSLFFSDADQQELLMFFNGFQLLKGRKHPIKDNSMTLVSIRMQPLAEIKEEEIVIKMLSPLIVRKHNAKDNTDVYYTCETEGFAQALQENIAFFLDKMGLDAMAGDFSIQVIKGKKVVVPVFGRNVDATIGIFKISGPCRLLNLLCLAGMGARRSEGHGLFEVIG